MIKKEYLRAKAHYLCELEEERNNFYICKNKMI